MCMLCLSGYSRYPPPDPPAQLSPNRRVILWLTLENGMGLCQEIIVGEIFLHAQLEV